MVTDSHRTLCGKRRYMSELLYKTLRESVVNAIRTKIMKRQIRLGERIVELELAQEFHTSRGPIREALRQLEIEGLVEYTRNVGCSVRRFSLMDSYEAKLICYVQIMKSSVYVC